MKRKTSVKIREIRGKSFSSLIRVQFVRFVAKKSFVFALLMVLTIGLAAEYPEFVDISNKTYFVVYEGKKKEVRFDSNGYVLQYPDGDETGDTKKLGRWWQKGNSVQFNIDLEVFYGTVDALGVIRGHVVHRKEVSLFVAEEKGAGEGN